jgi:hypothetical protein
MILFFIGCYYGLAVKALMERQKLRSQAKKSNSAGAQETRFELFIWIMPGFC